MVDYYTIGTADIGAYSSAAIKVLFTNPFSNYTALRVEKITADILSVQAIGLYIGQCINGYVYHDDLSYYFSGWGEHVLRWTNPNPDSTFLAQNVSVDLQNFKFALICFKEYTTQANFWTTLTAPVNDTATIHSTLRWTGNTFIGLIRQATVAHNGIAFSDAYYNNGTTMQVDNTALIPITVYGMQ